MTTISFTKSELQNLFNEYGMLIEACDEAAAEGAPRPDEATIRRLYEKISKAHLPHEETLEEWRARNHKRLDKVLGSKWDRFREVEYHANG